jgi:hypothetical protein
MKPAAVDHLQGVNFEVRTHASSSRLSNSASWLVTKSRPLLIEPAV